MIVYIYSENELAQLVSLIQDHFSDTNVFVLRGDLGAGKTTFVKAFCASLEVQDDVSSPTFSLVNEYELPSKKAIYHMDLYRIEDADQLVDIGFEEYLDSGKFIFIEWADLALPFLHKYIVIQIDQLGEKTRKFMISTH